MPSPAKISAEVQAFIVRGHARFLSPTQVANAVGEEFGVTLDRTQVREYNPTQRDCGKKWRELFDQERATFLRELGSIGISHVAYRLEVRHRLLARVLTKIESAETVNPQLYATAQSLLDGAQQEAAMILGAGNANPAGSEFMSSPNGFDLPTAARALEASLSAAADMGKLLPMRRKTA